MKRSLEGARVLVTGGGGFLGSAIVRDLLAQGCQVGSLSRGDYPLLQQQGCYTYRADLVDSIQTEQVLAAFRPDAVIHTAAKAGVWGPRELYHQANVNGTENLITAMISRRIKYLVYTSTPSVTFSGTNQEGADESEPYASYFFNAYQETKTRAERLALSAAGSSLRVVALRPHLIWGPGDHHLVPRILERARSGRLRLVDGGRAQVDAVYIDNASHAHLQALKVLMSPQGASISGKPYYVTNQDPWPLKRIINGIVEAAGLAPIERTVSSRSAYWLGATMEKIYKFSHLAKEPPMTRFVARQLSTNHWFSPQLARRDLAYRPMVSMEEGMERLRRSFI